MFVVYSKVTITDELIIFVLTNRSFYHLFSSVGSLLVILFVGDNVLGAIFIVGISVVVFILHEIKNWYSNPKQHVAVAIAVMFFIAALVCKYLSDKNNQQEEPYLYTIYHSW